MSRVPTFFAIFLSHILSQNTLNSFMSYILYFIYYKLNAQSIVNTDSVEPDY